MSKHTPTPWKVIHVPNLYLGIAKVDKDGCGIFMMDSDSEKDKANAELIVRAVNCHEDLTSCLENLMNIADKHMILSSGQIANVKSLLARARGESNV